MCGIVGIFNIRQQSAELRAKALKMSQKIRHRGPDWSGIYVGKSAILAHERLSIVDPKSGGQPLFSPDKKQILAVNGEIYNHREIRKEFAGKYDFQTGSDCEVILSLYKEKGINFLEDLSGIHSKAAGPGNTPATARGRPRPDTNRGCRWRRHAECRAAAPW